MRRSGGISYFVLLQLSLVTVADWELGPEGRAGRRFYATQSSRCHFTRGTGEAARNPLAAYREVRCSSLSGVS